MDKIEKVFDLIYNDSKLKEELMKKQTIDEMYEYCTSISGGYTKEGFNDFINEMCQYVNDELSTNNLSISDDDMTKVSGETHFNNKAISSLLAAITISTPLVGAAGSEQANTVAQEKNNVSMTQKVKDKAKDLKNFINNNPIKSGATAASIPLMVLLGITLKNRHKQPSQNQQNPNQEPSNTQETLSKQDITNHIESIRTELLPAATANFNILDGGDDNLTENNLVIAENSLDLLQTEFNTLLNPNNLNQLSQLEKDGLLRQFYAYYNLKNQVNAKRNILTQRQNNQRQDQNLNPEPQPQAQVQNDNSRAPKPQQPAAAQLGATQLQQMVNQLTTLHNNIQNNGYMLQSSSEYSNYLKYIADFVNIYNIVAPHLSSNDSRAKTIQGYRQYVDSVYNGLTQPMRNVYTSTYGEYRYS